jgi:hypothetical protein
MPSKSGLRDLVVLRMFSCVAGDYNLDKAWDFGHMCVGQASVQRELSRDIEKILMDEINLWKPDDLASLEFQVPYIVQRILSRLYCQGGLLK